MMKNRLLKTPALLILPYLIVINGAFAYTVKQVNEGTNHVRGTSTIRTTQTQRKLPKRPSGHSHSTSHSGYIGCLGLSDSELQSSWKLSRKPRKCQYTHHANKGNSASTGSSSGQTNGNYTSEVEEETETEDTDGSSSNNSNVSREDKDQVVSNGDFDNVNDNMNNGENDENGGNASAGENDGNAGNDGGNDTSGGNNGNGGNSGNNGNGGNGNGGNAGNNGNGGNGGNNGNGGNAGNNGNADSGQDGNNDSSQNGRNSGNDDGQGQNSFDPYNDFDIRTCDTYENLWLWDLSLTCETEGDPSSCECIFAEEMMELGSLSCEDAMSCPRSCPICSRCMKLLGCQVPNASTSFLSSRRSYFLLTLALGFLIGASAYYTRRKKRRGPSILQKQLLDDNSSSSDDDSQNRRVWLAPIATKGLEETSIYSYNNAAQLPIWVPSHNSKKSEKPVWLAPDATSVQLKTESAPVWLAPDASSEQLEKNTKEDEISDTIIKPLQQALHHSSNQTQTIEESSEKLGKTIRENEDEDEDSKEGLDTFTSDTSSNHIEDPSIGSIQFSLSASSVLLANASDANVVLPETVSDDEDIENFSVLT